MAEWTELTECVSVYGDGDKNLGEIIRLPRFHAGPEEAWFVRCPDKKTAMELAENLAELKNEVQ